MLDNYEQQRQDTLQLLGQLEQLALTREDELLAQQLKRAAEKLVSNLFVVLVAGEVKRGKSSFINALLGDPVLPTDVIPTTSIVGTLRYGTSEKITVFFEEGVKKEPIETTREMLWEFVTEEGNRHNEKQVSRVDIVYPSRYLEHGLVLVDTPGVGGLFEKHKDVTYAYLPNADAVCFVLGSDPPLTQSECEFLNDLEDYVGEQFFFVQTKVDLQAEADWRAALDNNLEVLKQIYGGVPQVFPVSAKRKLMAAQADDPKRKEKHLARSGFPEFEENLQQFLFEDKGHLTLQATFQVAAQACQGLEQAIQLEWSTFAQEEEAQQEQYEQRRQLAMQEMERLKNEISEVNRKSLAMQKWVEGQFKELSEQVTNVLHHLFHVSRGQLIKRVEQYVMQSPIETLQQSLPRHIERELTSGLEKTQKLLQKDVTSIYASVREQLTRLFEELHTKDHLPSGSLIAESASIKLDIDHEAHWLQEIRNGWYSRLFGTGTGLAIGVGLSLAAPAVLALAGGGAIVAGVIEWKNRRRQEEEATRKDCLDQARRWVEEQGQKITNSFQEYSQQICNELTGIVETEVRAATEGLQKTIQQAQANLQAEPNSDQLVRRRSAVRRQALWLKEAQGELKRLIRTLE